MKTPHTPRPWQLELSICHHAITPLHYPEHTIALLPTNQNDSEENGRLMVKAPEMFETLRLIAFGETGDPDPAANLATFRKLAADSIFAVSGRPKPDDDDIRQIDLSDHKLRDAAPSLLSACRAALNLIRANWPLEHGNPSVGKTWGALEDAIASATGKE